MSHVQAIASAIDGYFNLMYNSNDDQFPKVFSDSCLVHGIRDGKHTAWTAVEFRDIIRNRPSPAAMKSPREQAILSIEQTAPDLALARVRVRAGQTGFIDHLVFHRINDKWLITTKVFHVAQVFPPGL